MGRLLLVAHQRENKFGGPPWPLTLDEVNLFKEQGLEELSHELHTEASGVSKTRFRVLYQR
ncbi:MAG: hypothetical protein Q9M36_05250 [Sulfurovum sp.]|nr:hypothetical protein [Sulfurovum sp.]